MNKIAHVAHVFVKNAKGRRICDLKIEKNIERWGGTERERERERKKRERESIEEGEEEEEREEERRGEKEYRDR